MEKTGKSQRGKTLAGVKKIRRMYSHQKVRDASKKLEKCKDSAICAVLEAFDGSAEELLTKINDLKGPTTDAVVAKLLGAEDDGIKKGAKSKKHGIPRRKAEEELEESEDAEAEVEAKDDQKKAPAKKGSKKAPAKRRDEEEAVEADDAQAIVQQDDEVEIEICAPLTVGCPDKNDKGEETHLVTTADGFFACGSIKKNPVKSQ